MTVMMWILVVMVIMMGSYHEVGMIIVMTVLG